MCAVKPPVPGARPMQQTHGEARGLVILHTGEGKGKTTAALGLALRAVGRGLKVEMIQFLKSGRRSGEHEVAERLAPEFSLRAMGVGFVIGEWSGEDVAAAREAWAAACGVVMGGEADMVIMDEITFCIRDDVVPVQEVLALLDERPAAVHVVLTGRDAPPELVERADLVTEMTCVKHPFDCGVKAQQGIEF